MKTIVFHILVFIFISNLFTEVAGADEASFPNILLIVSEDNGQELGCYGDPYVKTPVLDQLAQEGVRFHNAYVPQAGCSQSRAAFLTGLYPHQNGQIGLATWKFRMYKETTPNLVRSLKEKGYTTGIIGKLHINPASAFPFDFKKIPTANFNRKNLNDYAKYAAEFFNSSKAPFFLYINYPDAHRPFIKQTNGMPKMLLTGDDVKSLAYFGLDSPELRKETANYYNCMNRLDSLIGDLLDELEESGKAQNTMIIYIGDHGADLLRGKRTSYEGGVRIPMIIKWPHKIKSGQIRNKLVSTLDIFPTIIEATQCEPIQSLPGMSLFPLLKNSKTKWREYLFTEYHLHSAHNFYPQRTVRDDRYKLIHNLQSGQINPGYQFTILKFYPNLKKVIENAPEQIHSAYQTMERPPEFELYDLKNDPYEFHNIANDENQIKNLERLKNRLARWRNETKDPFLQIENLSRLKNEIDNCFKDGKANKERLNLNYPDYFFPDKSNE